MEALKNPQDALAALWIELGCGHLPSIKSEALASTSRRAASAARPLHDASLQRIALGSGCVLGILRPMK